MALGTDRIQILQGTTAYLQGVIRSRLFAYDTDQASLVYSPDGLSYIPCRMSSDGSIVVLDASGKIPLSYLPDSILVDYYIHVQSVVASTWTISNPFKRPVNVSFVDSAGSPFITDYVYNGDYSVITATLAYSISGKAILN